MNKVLFTSRVQAENTTPPKGVAAIISINSDEVMPDLKDTWVKKLYLVFSDIDAKIVEEYPGDDRLILFSKEQAEQVIDFLDDVKDLSALVVHCDAGVSRSAAVAKFAAEYLRVDNFNHEYSLYNKYIYSTLRKARQEKMISKKIDLSKFDWKDIPKK